MRFVPRHVRVECLLLEVEVAECSRIRRLRPRVDAQDLEAEEDHAVEDSGDGDEDLPVLVVAADVRKVVAHIPDMRRVTLLLREGDHVVKPKIHPWH